ncbi:359_t:CDS:2, partial [Ambispora gerdemannii]
SEIEIESQSQDVIISQILEPKSFGDKETDKFIEELQNTLKRTFDGKRKLWVERDDCISKIIKLEAENKNQRYLIDELKKEIESKKNRKFQEKCILIVQILLNEEPVVEYRPSFMEGLELDAFFRSNQIALEVQGAQHRLHHTSWYKDVKKLEDIVNRDRKKKSPVSR